MKRFRVLEIIPWLILGLFILASFILMFNASQQESATMDELAHIPSGYGYVRYLDYRLNPEHPPLIKALAALPLLFQKLNFPTDKSSWQTDVNGQWAVGAQFLYESTPAGGQAGNDADKIIQWSRLGPMLLTILLIFFIYIWAKELIGRWWALFPTFLFGFSPTVLAHGHYVTTDIGAALGIFIASYYFVKFLFKPSRRHLIFAGVALGIAQLTKFSAVLLIPFFGFLIIVFCLWEFKNKGYGLFAGFGQLLKIFFRYIFYLIIIFAIGYFIVYLVYFVFTLNYPVEKQKSDTQFTLTSFAGGPDRNWESCRLDSKISLARRARCLAEINIWMSQNKILRPLGQYMLGVLMVFQRSAGGNTAYFLGEVSAAGWWYYFPVVFILKESIPSLILIAFALLLGIWRVLKCFRFYTSYFRKFWDYLATHFAEFSMLAFIVLYWAYSINSPLNIGVRHILPTMPFIYILTASSLKKWMNGKIVILGSFWKKLLASLATLAKFSLKGTLIGALLAWYLTETLFTAPHFLSYFNQFGGGTDNGYQYVTDSNYDWGQDLKRLTQWVKENGVDKISVDYFGGGNPKYYLDGKVEYWQSSKGNPKEEEIEWLAVSINNLQGALGKLHPGQNRNPEDEYRWLQKIKNPYQPDFRAGKSIFIYKLF